MNEHELQNIIAEQNNFLADLEPDDAVKGGLALTADDQDDEEARMLSTVTVKIRKPGK